jgi:hypothetical protein
MDVWVFTGERSSPSDTTPMFPSGVFSSLHIAEEWIRRHALSGIVTLYRVDVGAYDWAVDNGYFKPSKPHHETSEFIGRFSGGDIHHHYEAGAKSA